MMDTTYMARKLEQATDRKAAVIELGELLLAELAPAFSFTTDEAVSRAGVCKYRATGGTVALSIHYIKHATAADVIDTLLHETAHAIAGFEAGHGPEWKRVARSIGCSAERCSTLPAGMRGGRYEARCSESCTDDVLGYRQRMTQAMRTRGVCTRCNAKIIWTDHGSSWRDAL